MKNKKCSSEDEETSCRVVENREEVEELREGDGQEEVKGTVFIRKEPDASIKRSRLVRFGWQTGKSHSRTASRCSQSLQYTLHIVKRLMEHIWVKMMNLH